MKLVTFNRAMAPHAVGESRLVPDEVASRLFGEGVVGEPQSWPERPAPVASVAAFAPDVRRKQRYLTKGA